MKSRGLALALVILVIVGLLGGITGAVHAQAVAEVGFFEDLEVQPRAGFEVPVEVRDVEDLFAIDIEIQFDPAILQAEDANPDVEGIQAGLGTFLDAGLLLYNEIDNQTGVVRFAMTQVNPAEPKSGDGVILVLYFVAQVEGETDLEVSFVEASNRFGEEIILDGTDGLVTVSVEAPIFEATPIPTQDPGLAIPVPTLAPTPTETPVPLPTATEEAAPEEEVIDAEEGYPVEVEPEPTAVESAYPAEDAQAAEEESGASILDYWWAVLIVVLLAGGLGTYLVVSKKRFGEDQ